ncbi:MAG: hypothetical protein FWG66_01250, partial [Spirochaetes bacterium]|nr:hypothetical protein [Spirochaetota bacterium]
ADAGYTGIEKREEIKGDEKLSEKERRVSERKGKRRAVKEEIYGNPMEHLDCIGQPLMGRRNRAAEIESAKQSGA